MVRLTTSRILSATTVPAIATAALLFAACYETPVGRQPSVWEEAVPATWTAAAPEIPEPTPTLGARVYASRCSGCHGRLGDGNGPSALFLEVKPRDFTSGIYKYRSTAASLPADLDLFRTVTVGFPAFGMPSFGYLGEDERWAVVHHIKQYTSWSDEPAASVEPGEEPPRAAGWEERGRALYEDTLQCGQCHGLRGHADGPSARTLSDSWGQPSVPVDFSLGPAFRKNGHRPRDTVRVLMTGIHGTPMPAYWSQGDDTTPLWEVAWYVESLFAQAMSGGVDYPAATE